MALHDASVFVSRSNRLGRLGRSIGVLDASRRLRRGAAVEEHVRRGGGNATARSPALGLRHRRRRHRHRQACTERHPILAYWSCSFDELVNMHHSRSVLRPPTSSTVNRPRPANVEVKQVPSSSLLHRELHHELSSGQEHQVAQTLSDFPNIMRDLPPDPSRLRSEKPNIRRPALPNRARCRLAYGHATTPSAAPSDTRAFFTSQGHEEHLTCAGRWARAPAHCPRNP
jgi:hypothetical protein